MDLEFQEADVMWPEHQYVDDDDDDRVIAGESSSERSSDEPDCLKAKKSATTPMDILCGKLSFDCYNGDGSSSGGGDDFMREMVPPHVLVSRRIAGMMAGDGRALKGRRLSEVRNSILRMTGFLEL